VLHNVPADFLTQLKDAFNPSAILGAGRAAGLSVSAIATGPTVSCVIPPPDSPGQNATVKGSCPPSISGAG